MVICLVVSFTACGAQKSPEVIINAFFEAIKKMDINAISSCMIDESELLDEETLTSSEVPIIDYLITQAESIQYSVDNIEINDKKASAKVTVSHVDASPIFSEAMADYITKAFALAFSGVSSEADFENLFYTSFLEKVQSMQANTTSKTFNIECIDTSEGWKIDNFSEETRNVLRDIITCNLYSSFERLSELDIEEATDTPESIEEATDMFGNNAVAGQIIDVAFGDIAEFASITVKLLDCYETTKLASTFSSVEAKSGTKFVVIKAEIENITKSPISISNSFGFIDDKEREYAAYDDAFFYFDNVLYYSELAPNIPEQFFLVFNVPNDSVNYSLYAGILGTDDIIYLHTK